MLCEFSLSGNKPRFCGDYLIISLMVVLVVAVGINEPIKEINQFQVLNWKTPAFV